MSEIIGTCIFLSVGGALLAYATLGRLYGFHRPWRWQGGGQTSLVGELSISLFFLGGGLAIWQRSGLWFVPIVAAWVVGYISQGRANRRHAAQEDALRARNSANYPGIFDNPPPDDMDRIPGDELDVYDGGACTYLGRAAKHDLQPIIDRLKDMPEQGPNDLFLIQESLEMLPTPISEEFAMLLKKAFEERDFLVLRWMPPAQERKLLDAKSD